MKNKKIQKWRRLSEASLAVFLLGLPFLKVKGESAFRFDVPSLRLHFFGKELWMEEFFIVLAFTLFLTFLTVLLTLLFGRIWCGWLCPQTVIIDFTHFLEKIAKKPLTHKAVAYMATFLISMLVAADLIWYFVSPYDFFSRLFTSTLGNLVCGIWIVLSVLIFLQFTVIRRKFCATVCPYAKLQDVLFDNKTLLVAFNPERKEECLNCRSCTKVCPVGIDIRQGFNATCINCARCVDECTLMMGRKEKKPLISYVFGSHQREGSILRPNVIIVGVVTLMFCAFSLYLVGTRKAFDFTILQNYAFKPKIINNNVINSYLLKMKNMKRESVHVTLEVSGLEGISFLQQKTIAMGGGKTKGVTVYVEAPLVPPAVKASLITITAYPTKGVRVERQVNFLLPFE